VSKRCVNLLAHAYFVTPAGYHFLPLWLIAIPLEKGGVHTIILYELLYQRHQLTVTVHYPIFDLLGSHFTKKLPRTINPALLDFP